MVLINILGVIIISVILYGILFLGSMIIQRFNKWLLLDKKIVKLAWFASTMIITVSPFVIPIRVNVYDDLKVLSYGIPFSFIEQHTLASKNGIIFPFTTTLINPWGHSLTSNLNINLLNYICSVATIYILFHCVLYLLLPKYRQT